MLRDYFLTILAAFLQTVAVGFSWPALVAVWAAGREGNLAQVYWLAFFGGILTDLLTGRALGETAIFLLIITGVIGAFKSRFEVNWRWLILFLLAGEVVFRFL